MTTTSADDIWWHFKSSVKVGQTERFVISYQLYDDEEGLPPDLSLNSLWLNIQNIESITFRAAYLMGPYLLYCDVRTGDYHHSQRHFVSADQPQFEPMLQPQQNFCAELSLHNLKKKYVWIVDVASQIIFTNTSQVGFEITVGSSKKSVQSFSSNASMTVSPSSKLSVTRLTSLDLWNLNDQISPNVAQNEHLVVLTHGLHSNVPADLFYLKEQIEKCQKYYTNEQIVVKGYTGNVCKTEKGVKYLGTRLAEHIVKELYHERVKKISLVGHSLGGLVQTFAIAYISVNYPWFFEKVEPINFITLASPLLGIVTDNPAYVNLLLTFGIVGKTGQDLGLKELHEGDKPLLYFLPGEPTKEILKRFKRRTLYANALNDGIVPLYSASLLFLDYPGILEQLEFDKGIQQRLGIPTDFIKKNLLSPIYKAINLWAPQKFPDDGSSRIPKSSVIDSATSVLMPPLPDKDYIMDPRFRDNVIIHDKIYSDDDLPERESDHEKEMLGSNNVLLRTFTANSGSPTQNLEEKIARRWHEGLKWRKVVVRLKPDAHNNIVVRRRFSNAYGWPVIDHLTQNHFNSLDGDIEPFSNDLTVTETNKRAADHKWVNTVDKRSVFDVGPTGMISTVTDILDSLGKNNFVLNHNLNDTRGRESSFDQENLFKYDIEGTDLT
ncbi:LADA_0C01860g1_1 [Lachancea dasiensis]|uniref:LADA_0C01860g1_1 n=1 Tax=Lachancea dasiensis TaxID=1072105 RepID=A0A1G4IYA0_9SACH|nr:LADA_0C01860g1_1 [Lachancea dasiensis]